MTESKKHKVGEVIEVSDGTEVVRPDETRVTVSGDSYVLDVSGTYSVGDKKIQVK